MLLKTARNRHTSSRKIAVKHNNTRHLYASVRKSLFLENFISLLKKKFQSKKYIALMSNSITSFFAKWTEAYRCLVLLGLIATFRLCVYRFVHFVSNISICACRHPKVLKVEVYLNKQNRGLHSNKIIELFEILQKST